MIFKYIHLQKRLLFKNMNYALILLAHTKGGGMYLIFPVIVLVLVTVLLQCLSYSFGQNYKVIIADMHYDYDYDNDKKQDTKSVLKFHTKVASQYTIIMKLFGCHKMVDGV
jgi:uncharacterized membrane protein